MAVSEIGGYSIFSGGAWSAPHPSRPGVGVSCPTSSFCLREKPGFGNIFAWEAGTWSRVYYTEGYAHGSMGQTAGPLSCVPGSTSVCMYVDNHEYYTVDDGHWSRPLAAIPSSSGDAGAVSCSAEPAGGVSQPGSRVFSVGRAPTCTVVDYAGYAFTWHGSTWAPAGEI